MEAVCGRKMGSSAMREPGSRNFEIIKQLKKNWTIAAKVGSKFKRFPTHWQGMGAPTHADEESFHLLTAFDSSKNSRIRDILIFIYSHFGGVGINTPSTFLYAREQIPNDLPSVTAEVKPALVSTASSSSELLTRSSNIHKSHLKKVRLRTLTTRGRCIGSSYLFEQQSMIR